MELKFQSVFSWNGPVRGAFVCKNGQTMFAPERLQDDPFGPLYCRDDRMYIKDKYIGIRTTENKFWNSRSFKKDVPRGRKFKMIYIFWIFFHG